MIRKNIPFDFVLDYLVPLEVIIKPMFGMHAIYVAEKMVLVLCQRTKNMESNGVWIATSHKHHKSFKKEFRSLRSVFKYANNDKETEWQLLPEDADDFEKSVIQVCELIKQNDPRIGRIHKRPKTKSKSSVGPKKPSR